MYGCGIKAVPTMGKTYGTRVNVCRTESLADVARLDALQSVSRLRWAAFGVVLSIVPAVSVVLLGVNAVIVSVLTPKMDLSSSKRLEFYFQNPACYTTEYRQTAKRLRSMWTLYGWLAGAVIINFFF